MATNFSEETFDTTCSSCRIKNKNIDGDLFCLDCQDYYCLKCVDEVHKMIRALSRHKLVGRSEFQTKVTERCKQHATKVVDMYCTNHKIVACSTCMTLEHKSCVTQCVSEHIESSMELLDINGLKKNCTDVVHAAAERIQAIEENVRTLKVKKENVVNELKAFKEEIRVWLDKIAESAILDIDKECANVENKWTDAITLLQMGIKHMERYITQLNFVAHNQSQQFVCASLYKELASSAMRQTQEMHSDLKEITFMFAPSVKLKKLIQSNKQLGTSAIAINRSQLYMALKKYDKLPTSDKELAELIHVGARVVPGKHWNDTANMPDIGEDELSSLVETLGCRRFFDLKSGCSPIGTVMAVPPQTETGWIEVKWDRGESNMYKMGFNDEYEVEFYG